MNAFNTINLAGACILTSTENARELGIPSDRWIYALGGAGTKDSEDCRFMYGWMHSLLLAYIYFKSGNGLSIGGVPVYPNHSMQALKLLAWTKRTLTYTTSTRT
jgi:hypothetical protein